MKVAVDGACRLEREEEVVAGGEDYDVVVFVL
jgi:hypothetical protein